VKKLPVRAADVRGYGRLAVDATLGLTSLVETLHHNILRTPGVFGTATQAPAGGITGLVYRTIRGVTRLVGGSVDALLGQLTPLVASSGPSSGERETVLAVLNGVIGDHLARSGNPLAIPMQMRRNGEPLALTRKSLAKSVPDAGGKILLLIHGLCMSDLQWRRHGHEHGAALAADLGFTPVYLHYNSGLDVAANGRALADQLEALLRAWPVDVEELVVIGYSMGGLVLRSACERGKAERHRWLSHLRKIIFIGTPHFGAPLERGGNWIDAVLESSPYTTAFARLGKLRSAGITDLRHGSVSAGDEKALDRFSRVRAKPRAVQLPEGVTCYAIGASLAKKKSRLSERLLGDGLVPLASALGNDKDSKRSLHIPKEQQWIGYGMNHLDLLDRKEVYERIRSWLGAEEAG
jgi:pimeloyl-ACP methyl ester carboxylesterase